MSRVAIKIEEEIGNIYFVYFDPMTGEMVSIKRYKEVYVPSMGVMSVRHQRIADLARLRFGRGVTVNIKEARA